MNRCRLGDFLYFLIGFASITVGFLGPIMLTVLIHSWWGPVWALVIGVPLTIVSIAALFTLPEIVLGWTASMRYDRRCWKAY